MMYHKILPTVAVFASSFISAQTVAQKLDVAVKRLMNSPAAVSSSLSFYVTDASGKMQYEYQPSRGLSTASTQKIFTAAAALETLGKGYQYSTTAGYSGTVNGSELSGDVIISSNGDPTLGSWRYEDYTPENFRKKLIDAIKSTGILAISGNLVVDDSYFDHQTIPGGWPWDDLGNYYGAGVWGINWRENQFDINISGTQFKSFSYDLADVQWYNDLAAEGNSDQSLIFTAPYSSVALINGKLPAGKTTTVSGSVPNPPKQLGLEIKKWFLENGIAFSGEVLTTSAMELQGKKMQPAAKNFFTYRSPKLEKMVYYFMRKSINFYGETFIKTMAKEKTGKSDFKTGVSLLKIFWKSKGIESTMINFADGSGLSPQNYVSAKAEVQALLYSQKQDWFKEFYDGFPTQDNGMKMKSGTMRDTKSYAGYHTAKDGKKYVFAIILNNFGGSGGAELQKILNELK